MTTDPMIADGKENYELQVLARSLRNMLGLDYEENMSVYYNLGKAEARFILISHELQIYKDRYGK